MSASLDRWFAMHLPSCLSPRPCVSVATVSQSVERFGAAHMPFIVAQVPLRSALAELPPLQRIALLPQR